MQGQEPSGRKAVDGLQGGGSGLLSIARPDGASSRNLGSIKRLQDMSAHVQSVQSGEHWVWWGGWVQSGEHWVWWGGGVGTLQLERCLVDLILTCGPSSLPANIGKTSSNFRKGLTSLFPLMIRTSMYTTEFKTQKTQQSSVKKQILSQQLQLLPLLAGQ